MGLFLTRYTTQHDHRGRARSQPLLTILVVDPVLKVSGINRLPGDSSKCLALTHFNQPDAGCFV